MELFKGRLYQVSLVDLLSSWLVELSQKFVSTNNGAEVFDRHLGELFRYLKSNTDKFDIFYSLYGIKEYQSLKKLS